MRWRLAPVSTLFFCSRCSLSWRLKGSHTAQKLRGVKLLPCSSRRSVEHSRPLLHPAWVVATLAEFDDVFLGEIAP